MRWVLDHFGLARPHRFERTLLALVAVIVLLATGVLALVLWHAGELRPGTLRATYFFYLVGLVLAALVALRWTKLAMALLALAAIELGLGIATRLLPDNVSDPQRFAWHVLLQAVPIPSLDMVSSNGVRIHHTSQGTRGREPTEREMAERTVIAAFGGSSTYDIALSDGETWTDRLQQALGDRFLVINHGVPGYSTVEHVIQTVFYEDTFGKQPRCALYYVGWNDIRNAHIKNLDAGYADFHLPSQVDSQRTRRLGGGNVTFSPLLTELARLVSAQIDTVQYSWTLSGTVEAGSDPALEADFQRNLRTISAINRERGVKTLWIGQLLNRARLQGNDMYGWLPYVRDKDVWPLQQRFNEILARTATPLDDPIIPAPIEPFGAADFVDQGHFSAQGARRFVGYVAPAVARECAP
ncbi:MAG: hypothetical protein ACHQPH_02325 [Reyranellales bacterium]